MQTNRRVYVLNSDPVNNSLASRIASSIYPHQSCAIVLMKKSSMSELSSDDLKQLVYVGRDAANQQGQVGAKDFVKRFLAQFDKKSLKLAKDAVEHIYLLDGRASRNSKRNRLYAQHVADLLHENGFKRAVTHAISFPAGSKKGDVLEVDISKQPDSSARHVLVSSLTINKDVFTFISDVDAKAELDKAQHTFIANESKSQRASRLAVVIHSKQQDKVISIIESKQKSILASNEGSKKSRKHMARRLKVVSEVLKLASSVEWAAVLKQARGFFSSQSDSKINKMIAKLYAETQLAINHIKPLVEPVAPKVEVQMIEPVQQLAGKHAEPLQHATVEDQEKLAALKARVVARRTVLNTELGKYVSCCLAPFFASKAHTKISKIAELDALNAEPTLPSFFAKAEELKSNTQVISGTFYKRTAALLDEITQAQREAPGNN